MKKILSLVLAALMVFSMVPAIFAEEVADTTAAVEEVSEYQAAIDFLKLLGIYVGTSEDSFVAAAKEPVNRAQMALFTSRFITGQVDPAYWMTSENDSGFTDVDDLYEEAIGAISFASQKGIVNGVGEGLFDPETGVQYREAITMIVRALGYTYKASGYPWSYINKARELGLLDGIANIGYTEQINREVVAQLLFNALFVEQDGTNVAESTFNVGATIVLITATNSVVYGNESKVTRTDYVRFHELDAQGEPTGTPYHVAADKFNLDTKTYEDDAAVGTAFAVIYKNGCADILAAESLTTVYENRGETTVSYAKPYLTIAGSKYQIVDKYNELNKNQSWDQDAAGTAQVKVYQPYGLAVAGALTYSKYVIDSFQTIWEAKDDGTYAVYAQYSAVMDKYYRLVDGKWEFVDVDTLLAGAATLTGGFKKLAQDKLPTKLAYADFIVTDASNDGNADRVTVKQYGFGYITYADKKTDASKSAKAATFNITWATDSATTALFDNKTNGLKTDYVTGKSEKGLPFVTDYRWTGLSKDEVPNKSYVIYYVDETNREVDIIKVVDADAADGTYTVSGYLRGYDAANDTIYLDADYTAYKLGYDTLFQAPIKTKASNSSKNITANVSVINGLVNTYVTLVIVDNKVVDIDTVSAKAEYVYIDSLAAFEEDGIVANAYTTIGNEYTQIKIAELNGWTVGGFDYYLYFLSGLFDKNTAYQNMIPIKNKELYQVVYTKDGIYNLTTASYGSVMTENLTVNKYNYIVGTDGKGGLDSKNYVATNAGDFWMIFDKAGNVVTYNGALAPVVAVTGDVIKHADKDYVVYVDDVTKIEGLNKLSGKVTQYMIYNKLVNQIENSNLNIGVYDKYNWTILMQDVKTAQWQLVTIDPALVPNTYLGDKYAAIGVEEGKIYAVVDGKLSNTEKKYTTAEVCAYYSDNGTYNVADSVTFTGPKTLDEIKDAIATEIVAALRENWIGATTNLKAEFVKKITVYGIYNNALTTDKNQIAALVASAGSDYTVNYVYTNDGTAIAWVSEASTQFVFTGDAKIDKAFVVEAGVETDEVLDEYMPTISWSFNEKTGKLTVTYTAGTSKVAFDAATSSVKFSVAGVVTTVDAPVVVDGGLASFTQTIDATAKPADVDVTVVVDGTTEVIFW